MFKLVLFLLLGAIVNVAVAWITAASVEVSLDVEFRVRILDRSKDPYVVQWKRFSTQRIISAKERSDDVIERDSKARPLKLPSSFTPSGIVDFAIVFPKQVEADFASMAKDSGDIYVLSAERGIYYNPDEAKKHLPQLPSWYEEPSWAYHDSGPLLAAKQDDAHGWPLLSMRSQTSYYVVANGTPPVVDYGIRLKPRSKPSPTLSASWSEWNQNRVLPLRPIWRGLVIDVLFYAIAMWLMTTVAIFARRAWRNRHGLCPSCGYKLVDEVPRGCPECGWGRETEA